MARKATIQFRKDIYENFEADESGDGILQGEAVYLTDKKALVVGDGVNGVAGHPTLRPVANYYNTEVDGWTVTKDNNDIERKFWKDDFSVDSSENYTGDVASFTWDTANKKLTVTGVANTDYIVCNEVVTGLDRISAYININAANKTNGLIFGYIDSDNYYSAQLLSYDTGRYKVFRVQSGVISQIASQNTVVDYTGTVDYKIELVQSGSDVKFYKNGVLLVTIPNVNIGTRIGVSGVSNTSVYTLSGEIKELTGYPSISYTDPFTSDTVTDGRYQAVTGTVAYDDVNKRMNVITATGANGKASGRLKSYKFTEGSQIYDVTLPTGADGDFITLVTHSANGLMTDGIGVGLQSDGAGNWNLATLSGTTVTEGADSGLGNANVARIEIEKDVTGAYWYYIYDAAGTKPKTATGKLFTTLTEGYTGWYANGAGATTQTYAINNISIRAESIVGRTNIELTEEVFNSVTGEMETRTYFKPIHRGAMLETYHDGTQEVVGTTFVDDCQWDRSAEWVNAFTPTWDTVNGKIVINANSEGIFTKQQFGDGLISFKIKYGDVSLSRISMKFCSVEQNFFEGGNTAYYIESKLGGNTILYHWPSAQALATIMTAASNTEYKFDILKVGSSTSIFIDGVLKSSITDIRLTSGYIGFGALVGTSALEYRDIQIIAASSDAANGIAACIPPIGGGARYGVQEGASIEFTNKALRGNYDFNACVKTTVTDETPYYEMFFKNTTDDTAIAADSTTLKNVEPLLVTYTDFEQALNLGYTDRDDTISVQVRRHTSAPDEVNTAAYIDFMAVVPTKEVI